MSTHPPLRAVLWILEDVLLTEPGAPGEARVVSARSVPVRGAEDGLRGVPNHLLMAGLSRGPAAVAQEVLQRLGWLPRFSHVGGLDEQPGGSMSEGDFLQVAQSLGVEGGSILAVVCCDEHASAARGATMRVAAVPRGWTAHTPRAAEYAVSGVSAIPALLNTL